MPEFKLILTSDYEVWGNGSGCVENCVIDPTNSMLEVADNYGVPITFFLDVCEYWAFEKIEDEGIFNGNYTPAKIIREQLQNAVSTRHDVQLHFHPQWLNFEFITNQDWKLDYRYWRLPEVRNYHSDKWSLEKLFKEGIETLENLFIPIKNDYEVNAFRAGAWCIQPEEEILGLLKKNNIVFDTTVAPGRSLKDGISNFDFTITPENAYWEVGDKITEKGKSGIIELPIGTISCNKFIQFYFKLLKLKNYNKLLPNGCNRKVDRNYGINKSSREKTRQSKMLNFSDGTSYTEMKYITRMLMNKYEHSDLSIIPLVAISHSKTFGFSVAFEQYLKWVYSQPNISFSTFAEIRNELIKN